MASLECAKRGGPGGLGTEVPQCGPGARLGRRTLFVNECLNFDVLEEEINTRSQAVARIADHTAKNCRGSRDLGHAYFQGKLGNFVRLLVILHTKPCTKFEVSSSSSFGDIAL